MGDSPPPPPSPAHPRRFRAVSFTLDHDAAPLPSAPPLLPPPPPLNGGATGQAEEAAAVPQNASAAAAAQETDSVARLQPILQETVASLEALDASKTPENEIALAGWINRLCEVLEAEEERYMASPHRSPLIVCRNDYPIGHIVNIVAATDSLPRCLEFMLPEEACAIELKRAMGRFLVLVATCATNSNVVDEFEEHLPTEPLILATINATDDALRVWYIGLLGCYLNERRGQDVADIAVLPVPSASVGLPQFLFSRLRNNLAPAFLADPVNATATTTVELEHTLRCLASMGEYQEVLPPLLQLDILPLIMDLIVCKREGVQFGALELASHLIAHKWFALKFVQAGGVDVLLSVPTDRPIFLEASIAWCLSGLASLSTIMEKVLKTVSDAPKRLAEFAIFLLNGQQDITRKNALFFIAHALAFPAVLNAFDNVEGARVLLDLIAQPLALQRGISVANLLKHTVTALRQYFRAHVAVAAHLVRTTKVAQAPAGGASSRAVMAKRLPMNKPLHIDNAGHKANLEAMLSRRSEVVQFLTQTKWRPVEELVTYVASSTGAKNGIHLLLGLVKSCDSEFGNNAIETAACALQVLSVASILPLTYGHICDSVLALPNGFIRNGMSTPMAQDEEEQNMSGMAVLLQVAASDNADGQEHIELILSALETLNHLVSPIWVEESAQRASRRAAREGNSLHVLLLLLGFKGRMADSVRSLAVKCLLGLAKDGEVVDILATLNVDRVLGEIVNSEPTVAEHATVHRRLKRDAVTLLSVISGLKVDEGEISLATDAAARKIARDAIVRRSNVQFHRQELLELIHDHLDKLGLSHSARALYEEAALGKPDLVDARKRQWMWPRTNPAKHEDKRVKQTPLRRVTSLPSSSVGGGAAGASATSTPMPTTRPNRSESLSVWRATPNLGRGNQPPTALERLVREHLRHQHEKCPNPISVPPPFPLLDPAHRHVCPNVRARSAPLNTTRRLMQRQLQPPYGGVGGYALNMRSVHRQARWVRTYSTADASASYSCVCFRELDGRDDEIVIGTDEGGALRFNAWTAEAVGYWDLAELLGEAQMRMSSVQFHNGMMLTTSASTMRAVVWQYTTKDDLAPWLRLGDIEHAFLDDNMVVGAIGNGRAVGLYSVAEERNGDERNEEDVTPAITLQFDVSNDYEDTNVVKLGSLVMYNGLLWDIRRSTRPVFKFDKLSPYGRAAFNPSGLNVILNKDVWDLRNYRLLHSAPDSLDGAQHHFDHGGDILFSHINPSSSAYVEQRLMPFRDMVVVTDASSWTNIASYEINRPTCSLALHPNGGHFAIVTIDPNDHMQSEARLYELGRGKPDDNDSDMDDAQKEDDAVSASHSDDSSVEYNDDGHGVIGLGELGNEADFGDAFVRAMNEIMQGEEGDDDGDSEDVDDEDLPNVFFLDEDEDDDDDEGGAGDEEEDSM